LPEPFFFGEFGKNHQQDTWYSGIAAVHKTQAGLLCSVFTHACRSFWQEFESASKCKQFSDISFAVCLMRKMGVSKQSDGLRWITDACFGSASPS